MRDIGTNDRGEVTAVWAGHTIKNARRGFWLRGKPLYRTTEFRGITIVEEPGGGYHHRDWLAAYNERRAAERD